MKTETRFILSAIVCAAALSAATAATAAPAGGVVVTSVTVRVSNGSSLLVPHSVGEIRFPDWSAKKAGEKIVECRPGWGMTYRMLAVLGADGGDSVAMVQKGARQYATRLRAKAGPGRDEATLESVYDPTDDEGDSPKIPFETMVVRFRGGWFEAAKAYRDVVKDEPWLRQARARDFGRLREVSMWFWNRRSSDIVIPPVEKFQQDSGTPAALSWYWWHTPPYDTGYPFYWPPREGEENFRAGVRRLNRSGIYCQAYINGMCWDVDDPGWARGGERCVRRRADGTFKSTEWNRFDRHRLADMCGEAPEFQSILRDQVRRVLDCGFDSQYLDCIGNGGYGCCWSKEHAHPKGGGRHMVDDFAKFVRTVRSEHPGKGFCTEDVNESYLELFDSFIVTAPSYERFSGAGEVKVEKVPVFPAIYHGAYAGFGNYATIDGIPALGSALGRVRALDRRERLAQALPRPVPGRGRARRRLGPAAHRPQLPLRMCREMSGRLPVHARHRPLPPCQPRPPLRRRDAFARQAGVRAEEGGVHQPRRLLEEGRVRRRDACAAGRFSLRVALALGTRRGDALQLDERPAVLQPRHPRWRRGRHASAAQLGVGVDLRGRSEVVGPADYLRNSIPPQKGVSVAQGVLP